MAKTPTEESHFDIMRDIKDDYKKRVHELEAALRQASLDIMNLGAFLRLEGKTDLADISEKMHAAALAALESKS